MDTIFIEIDGAAGGEEGKLFAADLARMYTMWAQKNKLKVEQIGSLPVLLKCRGKNAYSFFAYEGGVHRVQRVPITEKRGRVHTSTVTVNVYKDKMPQKIKVNLDDCEITTCRSSGKGGQKVNKTETKVRILHRPTGIVVECQDERSQGQNKEIALQRLQDILQQREDQYMMVAAQQDKRQQVGTGARNEKIRTYNFHDNRVTDHRINYKSSKLKDIMNGDLADLITALRQNN